MNSNGSSIYTAQSCVGGLIVIAAAAAVQTNYSIDAPQSHATSSQSEQAKADSVK